MAKILRNYILVTLVILCATAAAGGVFTAAENSERTAFGEKSSSVAVFKGENALDISVKELHMTIQTDYSVDDVLNTLCLVPGFVGNSAFIALMVRLNFI